MTITLSLDNDIAPVIERDEETGRYFAVDDRLHVIADGATRAEAEARFQEALSGLVNYCVESGLPLPRALRVSRTQVCA
jgi:predicted RNase H-like HicB family nuclease